MENGEESNIEEGMWELEKDLNERKRQEGKWKKGK